jgi:predicted TIM-barrel fold metal-dependent hydrolase
MASPTVLETTALSAQTKELLISADSHVMEPHDLWTKALHSQYGDAAPEFPPPKVGEGFQAHPGGQDPNERIKEMATDGVSAEVLYPTLGLSLFGIDDADLQAACFKVYNDWLIQYCKAAPDRLLGVGCIPIYHTDVAVRELERVHKEGLRGAIIWQAPHPDLPFYSNHYDRFWAAAQELQMPISLHILTGHNYTKNRGKPSTESYRQSVNLKLAEAVNAVFDFAFYGILDRYPDLRLVMVENEIGWIPFCLQQWDYYYRRFKESNPPKIDHEPSYYFNRQVYATFFNDAVGGHNLSWTNVDNFMWSNDFPHPNSTWPNSRSVIERDLGHLPVDKRKKLVEENVVRLYNMTLPAPV